LPGNKKKEKYLKAGLWSQ